MSGGYIKLSEEVIKAREEADRIRNSKTLEQVKSDIRKERKARELLIVKNWFRKP
jgi:hypothetical protein